MPHLSPLNWYIMVVLMMIMIYLAIIMLTFSASPKFFWNVKLMDSDMNNTLKWK